MLFALRSPTAMVSGIAHEFVTVSGNLGCSGGDAILVHLNFETDGTGNQWTLGSQGCCWFCNIVCAVFKLRD